MNIGVGHDLGLVSLGDERSWATFSPDMKYRYALARLWDDYYDLYAGVLSARGSVARLRYHGGRAPEAPALSAQRRPIAHLARACGSEAGSMTLWRPWALILAGIAVWAVAIVGWLVVRKLVVWLRWGGGR